MLCLAARMLRLSDERAPLSARERHEKARAHCVRTCSHTATSGCLRKQATVLGASLLKYSIRGALHNTSHAKARARALHAQRSRRRPLQRCGVAVCVIWIVAVALAMPYALSMSVKLKRNCHSFKCEEEWRIGGKLVSRRALNACGKTLVVARPTLSKNTWGWPPLGAFASTSRHCFQAYGVIVASFQASERAAAAAAARALSVVAAIAVLAARQLHRLQQRSGTCAAYAQVNANEKNCRSTATSSASAARAAFGCAS